MKYTLPRHPEPNSPEDWLLFAFSDLESAKYKPASVQLNNSHCFLAQQAAEIAVKAVMVFKGLEIIKTHKLEKLFSELQSQVKIPDTVMQAMRLTPSASEFRYPGDPYEVEEEDWREAVRIAEITFDWAYTIITKGT